MEGGGRGVCGGRGVGATGSMKGVQAGHGGHKKPPMAPAGHNNHSSSFEALLSQQPPPPMPKSFP
jgi:hypothetical protein